VDQRSCFTGDATMSTELDELRKKNTQLTAERDAALERIENATMAAAETQPSWEHRCYAILSALGLDFGEPTPDIPEQNGWYAKKMQRLEDQLIKYEDEISQLRTELRTRTP
jgi:hypothetical protein